MPIGTSEGHYFKDDFDYVASQLQPIADFSWEKQTTIPEVQDDADTEGWTEMFERGNKTDSEILKNLPEDMEAFKKSYPGGTSWTGEAYPGGDMIWIRKRPKEKPKLEDLISQNETTELSAMEKKTTIPENNLS